ncbi:MAG: EAL domain-containing protein [Rubrivivax sp.]|nr:EAL domain-containing protein [Rubrivivax sp.]
MLTRQARRDVGRIVGWYVLAASLIVVFKNLVLPRWIGHPGWASIAQLAMAALFVGVSAALLHRLVLGLVLRHVGAHALAERAQAEREQARRLLDRIAEASTDAIFAKDLDGRYLLVNRAACELLGRPAEEILGRSDDELFAPGDRDAVRAHDASALAAGGCVSIEEELGFAGGQRLLDTIKGPLVDADGRAAGVFGISRDITARRAAEERLQQLSQAVEQASDRIMITDLAGRIVYANAATLAASGYALEELLGRNARALQAGDTPREHHRELWACLLAGRSWQGQLHNRHKDGSRYVESATISPVRRADGRVTHYIAVKTDVTELRRLHDELDEHRHRLEQLVERRTAELQQARRAAEAANEAKSAFLAAMSHEIRTPMNGVVGLVDVLRQSELTPYQADLADTIRESARSLLALIDEVLDFSKIEAGHLALAREPVALRPLLESVCDALQPVAAAGGVLLTGFVDPALPSRLLGDAGRLRQILNNLVGNAIKFCGGLPQPGRVHVRLRGDDGGALCVEVTDNGIGIDPALHQRIFRPFEQAEAATVRRYGGTGLGLSIVRRLAEACGGAVTLDSAPGQGARFAVTLPLPVLADTAPQPRPLQGCRVHLRLDDAALAHDGARQLRAAGAEATVWDDAEALAAAVASDPQAVVLCGLMPATGACAGAAAGGAARRVQLQRGRRRRPRLDASGIVMLDVDAMRRDALVDAVALAAGREAVPAGAPVPVAASAARRPAPGSLVLVAEDHPVNQKVIRHQLELLALRCEIVGDGAAALAAWRTLRPALLLTDLHMPGMDGYALAAALRAAEAAEGRGRLPIVALTAQALHGEAERCRAAGMDDYLSKPVDREDLAATLARWLPVAAGEPAAGSGGTSEAVAATAAAAGAPAAGPAWDDDAAAGQEVGDETLVAREQGPGAGTEAGAAGGQAAALPVLDPHCLPRLIGDDPVLVGRVQRDFVTATAADAAAMAAAQARGDTTVMAATAHRLKSSARMVGALALGGLCEQIEQAARHGDGAALATLQERFAAAADAACQRLAGAPAAADATVLVVDDDPLQRELLTAQVAALGAGPVAAFGSGAAALDWLQGRDTRGLLTVLDLNMPGMDGVETLRHLARRGYAGALALASGAEERVVQTSLRLAEAYRLRVLGPLRKPPGPGAVRGLLDDWRGALPRSTQAAQRPFAPAELRRALDDGELCVHYQPQVALSDGRLVGVEALVRWQHPRLGLIGPDRFVPLAEAEGWIGELTWQVLDEALAQQRDWRAQGLALRMAVNVSMDCLSALDFPERLLARLQAVGGTPDALMLEVTESRLTRDWRATMDILARLRLKGIGLAIDDFGTGHSSLAQLRDLPFGELKLDRSFVHGGRGDAARRAILEASIEMAHRMGLQAVAEGVEDAADRDFVRALGCDLAQGWLYARAMPAAELALWAARQPDAATAPAAATGPRRAARAAA